MKDSAGSDPQKHSVKLWKNMGQNLKSVEKLHTFLFLGILKNKELCL